MANRSTRVVRQASHAGSWYTSSSAELSSQLNNWLDAVAAPVTAIGPQSNGELVPNLPVKGARIVIAPHAGYSYSGPAAAWAYKAWDVSQAKRIFLLGPSHHHYLSKAALSKCTHYATPLGDLTVDQATTAELHNTGMFECMSQSVDEDEHSLEMHLPYIYSILARNFGADPSTHPLLVPVMVGNTSASTERKLAAVLAPYLQDSTTAWVVSSDFAHWGLRFRYTYYRPATGPATQLSSSARTPKNPEIHESIRDVDFECMGACESGSHDAWLACLESNGNTVCGRHPIGVIMKTVEEVRQKGGATAVDGQFRFLRYERSSEVRKVSDSSVSYASAFAVI